MAIGSEQQQIIERTLTDHMGLYGYELVELPLIEKADVFLTRAGDKIRERLFTFERSGQLLALRPEFTVSAAHKYINQNLDQQERWQFSGPIFEYQAQAGATSHSLSIGAELIGDASQEADAEIIALAATGLQKLGICDWEIVVSHVGLHKHLLSRFGLDHKMIRLILSYREDLQNGLPGRESILNKIRSVLPDITNTNAEDAHISNAQTEEMLSVLLDSTRYGVTMGGRSRAEIAQRLLDKRRRVIDYQNIDKALDFLAGWIRLSGMGTSVLEHIDTVIGDDPVGLGILESWKQTISLLGDYEIAPDRIHISMDLVRDWDYYSGLVFGIRTPAGDYLAGGGRYDELTQMLGTSRSVPAVGFAYYIKSLLATLPAQHRLSSFAFSSVSLPSGDVIRLLSTLRDAGIRIYLSNTAESGKKNTVYGFQDHLLFQEQPFQLNDPDSLIHHLKKVQE